MQYQQYAIEMELTGMTRKQAAEQLSAVLGKPYAYDNATDAYSVADNFGRNWKVGKAYDITNQKYSGDRIVGANFMYAIKLTTPLMYQKDFGNVSLLMNRLQSVGAITNDSTKLSINVNAKNHTEKSLQNLANTMESKGELIYRAINSKHQQPFTKTEMGNESVIKFSMFNSSLSADKIQSYVHLATGINQQAITQNNISPKKNESPNDKFTFRTWLIRLGMIGSDYKTTRATLLENLEGNTAWKNPEMSPHHRAFVQDNNLSVGNDQQNQEKQQVNESEFEVVDEQEQEQDQGMTFGSM